MPAPEVLDAVGADEHTDDDVRVVAIASLPDPKTTCAVCYETVPLAQYVGLACGHAFCQGCLHGWAMSCVQRSGLRAAFPCPCCRRNCRIDARLTDSTAQITGVPDGVADAVKRTLVAVEDAFHNWHVSLITVDAPGETRKVFQRKPSETIWAVSRTIWFAPFGPEPWSVPDGRPSRSDTFQITSKWKSADGRWSRHSTL